MIWCGKHDGGDCSNVKATLRAVDQINSIANAYVAVLKDTTVGTCGGKIEVGDCSNVKAALGRADTICSTDYAFLSSRRIRLW